MLSSCCMSEFSASRLQDEETNSLWGVVRTGSRLFHLLFNQTVSLSYSETSQVLHRLRGDHVTYHIRSVQCVHHWAISPCQPLCVAFLSCRQDYLLVHMIFWPRA